MPDVLSVGPPGTTKLIESLDDTLLRSQMVDITGDHNWLARPFNETEPNYSPDTANDIGELSSNQNIHISGHLNGQTDLYDYFKYTVADAGQVDVKMYENVPPGALYSDTLLYHETFSVQPEDNPYYYWGWATGNADFDYDTYISFSLIA